MAKIQWRNAMAIGQPDIDADHKHLIEIINQFVDLDPKEFDHVRAMTILGSLSFYAQVHFHREEYLQRQIEFPLTEAHHREHERLEIELKKVVATFADQKTAREMHGQISSLLSSWLLEHVLKSDIRMKEYIKRADSRVLSLKPIQEISEVEDAWV